MDIAHVNKILVVPFDVDRQTGISQAASKQKMIAVRLQLEDELVDIRGDIPVSVRL